MLLLLLRLAFLCVAVADVLPGRVGWVTSKASKGQGGGGLFFTDGDLDSTDPKGGDRDSKEQVAGAAVKELVAGAAVKQVASVWDELNAVQKKKQAALCYPSCPGLRRGGKKTKQREREQEKNLLSPTLKDEINDAFGHRPTTHGRVVAIGSLVAVVALVVFCKKNVIAPEATAGYSSIAANKKYSSGVSVPVAG